MATFKNTDDILFHIRNRFCVGCNDHNGTLCRSCRVADCMDEIDDAPTTFDAMLVVHGHWVGSCGEYILPDTNGKAGPGGCNCSCCRAYLGGSGEYAVNGKFCPSCGALMDENVGESNG